VTTSASSFAAAVFSSVASVVPAGESFNLTVETDQVTDVVCEIDGSLDLSLEANRDDLMTDMANAVCVGFVGSCTVAYQDTNVTIIAAVQRRRLSTQYVALNITRSFSTDSPEVTTNLTDAGSLITAGLSSSYGAVVVSSDVTSLSSSALVQQPGGSTTYGALDEAFAAIAENTTGVTSSISAQLPGVQVIATAVSVAVRIRLSPSIPPLSPPSPSPPPPSPRPAPPIASPLPSPSVRDPPAQPPTAPDSIGSTEILTSDEGIALGVGLGVPFGLLFLLLVFFLLRPRLAASPLGRLAITSRGAKAAVRDAQTPGTVNTGAVDRAARANQASRTNQERGVVAAEPMAVQPPLRAYDDGPTPSAAQPPVRAVDVEAWPNLESCALVERTANVGMMAAAQASVPSGMEREGAVDRVRDVNVGRRQGAAPGAGAVAPSDPYAQYVQAVRTETRMVQSQMVAPSQSGLVEVMDAFDTVAASIDRAAARKADADLLAAQKAAEDVAAQRLVDELASHSAGAKMAAQRVAAELVAERAAAELAAERAAAELAEERAASQLAAQWAASQLAAEKAASKLAAERAAAEFLAERAAAELSAERAAAELAAERAAADLAAERADALALERAAAELAAAERAAAELAAERASPRSQPQHSHTAAALPRPQLAALPAPRGAQASNSEAAPAVSDQWVELARMTEARATEAERQGLGREAATLRSVAALIKRGDVVAATTMLNEMESPGQSSSLSKAAVVDL